MFVINDNIKLHCPTVISVSLQTNTVEKSMVMVSLEVANQNEFDVIINSVKLDNVISCKCVGVTLDNQLKYSATLEHFTKDNYIYWQIE